MRDDLENIKGAKERVETGCSTWRGYFRTRRYRGASLLCNWRVIRDPDWAIQTQISSLGIQLGHCCWGTIFLD